MTERSTGDGLPSLTVDDGVYDMVSDFSFDVEDCARFMSDRDISEAAISGTRISFHPWCDATMRAIQAKRKPLFSQQGTFLQLSGTEAHIEMYTGDIAVDWLGQTVTGQTDEGWAKHANHVLAHELGHMVDFQLNGAKTELSARAISRIHTAAGRIYGFGKARLGASLVELMQTDERLDRKPATVLGIGSCLVGAGMVLLASELEKRRYARSPRERFARDFAVEHAGLEVIAGQDVLFDLSHLLVV